MAKKTTGGKRVFERIGQYFVYAAFRFFELVLFFTPLNLCWRLGEWFGTASCYLLPKYRALAIRNLTIAFGKEKSSEEIRRLARRNFAVIGRNFLCSLKVTVMSIEKIEERVTFKGEEEMKAIAGSGNGVVIALMHLGNWELSAQLKSLIHGIDEWGSLYQRLKNPFMDKHVRRLRAKSGLTLFDRKSGFYKPMQLLRDGGALGVFVDQHAGDGGVWCPFFGRLASTSNLAVLLGSRTGSKIVPLALLADGVGRWKAVYGSALDPATADGGGGGDGAGVLTAELNREVEDLIRIAPEEWFWVHNRWKTPKPNFLFAGYKRGVRYPADFDDSGGLQPFRVVVRSPNHLGDACIAIPAVRAIKRGRPDVELTVLGPAGVRDLWERVEEVDHMICREGGEGVWSVGRRLREAGRFDVGIVFPNSLRSVMEMRVGGIPRVVGYAGHHRRWLMNQVMPEPPQPRGPEHQVNYYLRLAGRLGADVKDVLAMRRVKGRGENVKGAAENGEPVKVAICAGARYGPAKMWPLERFAAAVKQVRERAEVEWILLGAPGEEETGERLITMIGGRCKNLVGKTSMGELMDELGRCRLLLTNDTGTMHLADFLGVPTVAIFGSTDPALTGPIGDKHRVVRRHVECSPCFLRRCPLDFRCMEEVTATDVSNEVLDELGVAGRLYGSGEWNLGKRST
ncbi:MAG: lipopolysaccharide heptosyltransferase II [Verrucomicrobiota bacterium]